MTKPRVTHARTREDADKGVDDCILLMTSGEWETGTSHRVVAEKHGVSPRTVEVWATAASRVIRRAMGDEDDIRSRMSSTLEGLKRKALDRMAATMSGELYPNPDVKAAINAVEAQAKVLGIVQTGTKVDVRVQVYEGMQPPQMLEALEAQIAKLQQARAALLARMNVVQALPAHDGDE